MKENKHKLTMGGGVSIIIPVYNGEQYVRRCLDSIIAQTFTDWECILVDDGSTDKSGRICEEYAERDTRIKVIHKANEGVSKTRWIGVLEALGEWIAFVDVDDALPQTALMELYNKGKENNLDIVLGASIDIDGNKRYQVTNKIPTGVYDRISYIKSLLLEECIYGPACKIIKRKLFDEKAFALPNAVYQNEDMYMNIVLGGKALRIGIYNEIQAYYYTMSSSSSVGKRGLMPASSWQILFCAIRDYLLKDDLYEKCRKEFSSYVYRRMYLKMLNSKKACFEFHAPCYTTFEHKVSLLNKYPGLCKLYFQYYRISFIIKNIFK